MMRIAFLVLLSLGIQAFAAAQDLVDRAREMIRSGRYVPALRLLEPVARAGNIDAQHELGRALVAGPSSSGDDFAEGLGWLDEAVKGGSVAALDTLGRVLVFGSAGIPGSDPQQGVALLEKAASRGYGPALEALGEHHSRQAGPAEAVRSCAYFRRAFEADSASGAQGLERCARTGQGMARDPRKALALYSLMRSDVLQHGANQERLRAGAGRDLLAAADKDALRWRARKVRRLPDWQIPLVPLAADPLALAERVLRQLLLDPLDARTRRPWTLDAMADRHASAALARSGVVFGSEAWWKSFGELRPRLRAGLAEAYRECARSAGETVRQRQLGLAIARNLSLYELSDAVAVLDSRLGRAADQFLLEFEIAENRAQQRLREIGADLSLEDLGADPVARLRALREQERVPALTQAETFAASDFFRLAGGHPVFRFSLGAAIGADEFIALSAEDLRRLDRMLPAHERERAALFGGYPPIKAIREAAKAGLEEIAQACEAHGKRLVHDVVEQATARQGR